MVYRCAKQHSESTGDKRGTKADELHLTPLTHAQPAQTGTGVGVPGVVQQGNAALMTPELVTPKRSPAHYLWAVLIARIYEVFPLLCPMCCGQMRLIAFITEGMQTGKILDHIGVESEPPHISPARGPPLWDGSAPGTRRAPQITLLNTKPWWWTWQVGRQIDCFTRIEGAFKVRYLAPCG